MPVPAWRLGERAEGAPTRSRDASYVGTYQYLPGCKHTETQIRFIDCSSALPDEMERRIALIPHLAAPVFVISPYAAIIADLTVVTHGVGIGVAPASVGFVLLKRLRLLKATTRATRLPRAVEATMVLPSPTVEAAMVPPSLTVEAITVAPSLTGAAPSPLDRLTAREREALRMVAEGLIYKHIAGELHVGESTVKTLVRNIKDKLDAGSQEELIAVYRRSTEQVVPIPYTFVADALVNSGGAARETKRVIRAAPEVADETKSRDLSRLLDARQADLPPP